tara:strand:- start:28 stop:222 length:195 start_codon:yes stop_codon:yes gene_type:complete
MAKKKPATTMNRMRIVQFSVEHIGMNRVARVVLEGPVMLLEPRIIAAALWTEAEYDVAFTSLTE